jgi:hypothetical protein
MDAVATRYEEKSRPKWNSASSAMELPSQRAVHDFYVAARRIPGSIAMKFPSHQSSSRFLDSLIAKELEHPLCHSWTPSFFVLGRSCISN